jgi:hypothetical protein
MTMPSSYLPPGLPIPVPEPDGVSAPYWNGLQQACCACSAAHTARPGSSGLNGSATPACNSTQPGSRCRPSGLIFSWERIWHPAHPALKDHGAYLAVVVELPHAGRVRMVGNLLGDPLQQVRIGAEVQGVFEHHPEASQPYTLLQWRCR